MRLSTLILILAVTGIVAVVTNAQPAPTPTPTASRYLDQTSGITVEKAVEAAMRNNGEIEAMRREMRAGDALIRQARLRANPTLETSGNKMLNGPDNGWMVQGELPLELGGRRGARIRVAEREIEVRAFALAERERQVAAEVRTKFGESLAAILKLGFTERMIAAATDNYNLVAAQVNEGRRPPLDQAMETVELNRLRAMRESAEGQVEVRLLELRNLMGIGPEEPLRLRGELTLSMDPLPPEADAAQRALRTRPDLEGARSLERLAAARTDQARAEGRYEADVMLGFQRMRTGFPLSGTDAAGMLMPIDMRSSSLTFGVRLTLPVRNRNQGMVAASIEEEAAARSRREFGELTVKREVAAAYSVYNRAARSSEIFRMGVRDQAAQNLDVVRQTYEIGTKTLLEYISELRRFIDIEIGFIDVLLEAYAARVEVMRASNDPELVKK